MVDKLRAGKLYVRELFVDTDTDSGVSWIEGWICGFTDPVHPDILHAQIREELFNYLTRLKEAKDLLDGKED